jgi:hypothetical protein
MKTELEKNLEEFKEWAEKQRPSRKFDRLVGRFNCLRGKHKWVLKKHSSCNFSTGYSSSQWYGCEFCGKVK